MADFLKRLWEFSKKRKIIVPKSSKSNTKYSKNNNKNYCNKHENTSKLKQNDEFLK